MPPMEAFTEPAATDNQAACCRGGAGGGGMWRGDPAPPLHFTFLPCLLVTGGLSRNANALLHPADAALSKPDLLSRIEQGETAEQRDGDGDGDERDPLREASLGE